MKSIELLATSCTPDSTPQRRDHLGRGHHQGLGRRFFRIDVTDGGEHGKNDTYGITMSDGYSSGQQPLEGGDVRIDTD